MREKKDFKKWTKPEVRNLGVISSFRYHLEDIEEDQCKPKVNRKRTCNAKRKNNKKEKM